MPTVFTHSLIGYTASQVWQPAGSGQARRAFVWLSVIMPLVPDLDGLPHWVGEVPREALWAHRGLTHSLPAAVALGAVAAWCLLALAAVDDGGAARGSVPESSRPRGSWWRWVGLTTYFSSLVASHGLLDMATNGGSGIALFAPFSDARLFWPVRAIHVSPLSPSRFLSESGWNAIVSELFTLWTLCGALLIVTRGREAARRFGGRHVGWLTSAALVAMGLMAWVVGASRGRFT